MKNLSKNFLWVIIFFLMISLVFSFFTELQNNQPEKISISQLAERIESNKVESITVAGNTLEIILSDGVEAVSQKENEAGLSETLQNYGVSTESLRSVNFSIQDESGFKYWAGILIPTLLPIIIIVAIFFWIFKNAKGGANQMFNFGKANLKLSVPNKKTKVLFDDVAGLKEAKEELLEVVQFLKTPKKFLDIGARIPRGVLLVGPPGTGKTLLARAVAGESKVPFFHISASEFVEMFVGVGASRVRDIFGTAKKTSPSIIFIDEIDAVGRQRGAGLGGGHDEREQTLNQILVEMDGFDRDSNVIVIAATNRPDILDKALLRPGRFDRQVFLDMPDIQDRTEILKIHSKEKPLDKDVDFKKIAVRTPGFSGADLANLMNEAAIFAARQDKKKVSEADVLESIEKVILGPERTSRVISDKERKITAFHEAGHALVAAALKEADPVHKVSIVSRGVAGGYTIKLPTEERRLKTKSHFIADLAVALGGYVAETQTFKDLTTGSSNDLKKSTEIAKNLVTKYGMSDKLGPRTFGNSEGNVFLGKEISSEKDYSEDIASKIDEEVDKIINKAFKSAKKIISKNKKVLKSIAEALMEKETLEQEEFYKIIKKYKLKPVDIS
ncbi:MAG: ATP-dependent zinc metalloprotease FtsH [Candidatus Paceibacterota bacterium]